jgi:hypothetical protein
MSANEEAKKSTMTKKRTILASELGVLETDGRFALALGDEILTTSGGQEVIHERESLISHMVSELDHYGQITLCRLEIVEPKIMGSYLFYSIQQDWVEQGRDDLTLDFGGCIVQDGTLFRCAGPECIEQFARWSPVLDYLEDLQLALPDLSGPFSDNPEHYASQSDYEEAKAAATPNPEFVEGIYKEYERLSSAQKAVVMMLFANHDGVVLFPMILVLGRCSANDYASGVVASQFLIAGVIGDAGPEDHGSMYAQLREDARTAIEFLECIGEYQGDKTNSEGGHQETISKQEKIKQMLKIGETKYQEFKSTLRWNIRDEKNDDVIIHSCLKTIAAFLNSDGGKLLIGVDDSGNPVGIELDKFPSSDKFLLYLKDKVKTSMSQNAATLIEPDVCEVEGKTVCLVSCERNTSTKPILVKFKSADEEYFVRAGPSTEKLSASSMIEYEERRRAKLAEDTEK